MNSTKGLGMRIETAIKHLEADADFLGMAFFDFIAFVKQNPLAQTQKTIEAYAIFAMESKKAWDKVA
jgi:hypothetical protein